ncbi:hypothetical protein M9Y10_015082 [Tritrichomonas musculus]|uniref:Uncharacterized protein n=1 Tax=Tritrichomonas musculus TaxID=1915356 RepID=A0ABR2L1G4_9EUKA
MYYDASGEYNTTWYLPITSHFTQIDMPAKIVLSVISSNNVAEDTFDTNTQFKALSGDGVGNVWTVKFNTLQRANPGTITVARTN